MLHNTAGDLMQASVRLCKLSSVIGWTRRGKPCAEGLTLGVAEGDSGLVSNLQRQPKKPAKANGDAQVNSKLDANEGSQPACLKQSGDTACRCSNRDKEKRHQGSSQCLSTCSAHCS